MSTNTRGVRALILTSGSALALAGLADVHAATKDAHLSVTVSVVAKCTISTAAILSNEAASVMCTSDARGAVSGDTNGTRPAYTVKRVQGALTTYGPVSTSRGDSTGMNREAQVLTITF